jgi:hypothetical protein
VSWRRRIEYTQQQRGRHLAVEGHPALHQTVDHLFSRQDNERTDLSRGQLGERLHELVSHAVGEGFLGRARPPPPDVEPLKEAPQLALEHHGNDDREEGEKRLEEQAGQVEIEEACHGVEHQKTPDGIDNKARVGTAQ